MNLQPCWCYTTLRFHASRKPVDVITYESLFLSKVHIILYHISYHHISHTAVACMNLLCHACTYRHALLVGYILHYTLWQSNPSQKAWEWMRVQTFTHALYRISSLIMQKHVITACMYRPFHTRNNSSLTCVCMCSISHFIHAQTMITCISTFINAHRHILLIPRMTHAHASSEWCNDNYSSILNDKTMNTNISLYNNEVLAQSQVHFCDVVSFMNFVAICFFIMAEFVLLLSAVVV